MYQHNQLHLPGMGQTACAVQVQESEPTISGFTPIAQAMASGIAIHRPN